MFKVNSNFLDVNNDRYGIQIIIFWYEIRLFYTPISKYAGYVDHKDKTKGINRYSKGYSLDLEFNYIREVVVPVSEEG